MLGTRHRTFLLPWQLPWFKRHQRITTPYLLNLILFFIYSFFFTKFDSLNCDSIYVFIYTCIIMSYCRTSTCVCICSTYFSSKHIYERHEHAVFHLHEHWSIYFFLVSNKDFVYSSKKKNTWYNELKQEMSTELLTIEDKMKHTQSLIC